MTVVGVINTVNVLKQGVPHAGDINKVIALDEKFPFANLNTINTR